MLLAALASGPFAEAGGGEGGGECVVTVGSGSWKQCRVVTEVGDTVPCHPCSQSLLSSVVGDAEGLSVPRPDPRVLGVLLGNPKPDSQAPGRPGSPSLAEPLIWWFFYYSLCIC